MDKLRSISLILIGIVKECIAHTNLWSIFFDVHEILKLLEPHPIIRILRVNNLILQKLIHNINVMNNVKDQSFHFREKKNITFVVKTCVFF